MRSEGYEVRSDQLDVSNWENVVAACRRCNLAKSNRLLPEKDGLCPACVKKWDTLKRIAGYLKPYMPRAVVLVLFTVSGTLIELLPPLAVLLLTSKGAAGIAGAAFVVLAASVSWYVIERPLLNEARRDQMRFGVTLAFVTDTPAAGPDDPHADQVGRG